MSDNRILLSLDALFDTRMGTLMKIDPALSLIAAKNGYFSRQHDKWDELTGGKLTNETFKEAYKNRNLDTLEASTISRIPVILNSYLSNQSEAYLRKVTLDKPEVVLNYWPYMLPGPVLNEILNCIRYSLPDFVSVRAVSMSMADMTPAKLRERYNAFMLYDMDEWFRIHHSRLHDRKSSCLTLTTAHIYRGTPLPDQEEEPTIGNVNGMDGDPIDELRFVMQEFIQIDTLPAVDFSCENPYYYDDKSSSSSSSEAARSASSSSDTNSL